jgi:alpha-glucosidase
MINNQVTPIGHYLGYSQEEDGTLVIRAQNGIIKIFVINQNVINIQVLKHNEEYNNFSYAVVRREQEPFDILENNNSLSFRTEHTLVTIRKNPLRILFYSHHGELLNEDDPTFGISWLGNEITNYKYLRPDEHFMGLGEKAGSADRFNSQHTNRIGG